MESKSKALTSFEIKTIHDAVRLGDLEQIKAFLEKGPKEIVHSKDSSNNTPLYYAAKNGDLEGAKLLLNAGASVNAVNDLGISIVQQVMRSGNMKLLNLFRQYSDPNEWQSNEKANIHKSTLASCKTDFNEVDFNAIDIEQISFEPLAIAQKFCTTMVRLKNGNLYALDGVDAKELRMYLLEKKFGPEYAEQHANVNVLTAHVSPGHGFLRLDSEAPGAVYHKPQGFYPQGRLMKMRQKTEAASQETNEVELTTETIDTQVPQIAPMASLEVPMPVVAAMEAPIPVEGKPLFEVKAIIEFLSHYGSASIQTSANLLLQSENFIRWCVEEDMDEIDPDILDIVGELLGYAASYAPSAVSISAKILLKTGQFVAWYGAKQLETIEESLKNELGAILGFAAKYGPPAIQLSANILLKSAEFGAWYASKQLTTIDEQLRSELGAILDFTVSYGPPALVISAQALLKTAQFSSWYVGKQLETVGEELKEEISTVVTLAAKYGPPVLSVSANALLVSAEFGTWYASKQLATINEQLQDEIATIIHFSAMYGPPAVSIAASALIASGRLAAWTAMSGYDIGRSSVQQIPTVASKVIVGTQFLGETAVSGAKALADFTVASVKTVTETTSAIKSTVWEARLQFRKFRSLAGEQEGMAGDEYESEQRSIEENHLKIMFLLDDDQARSAFARINEVQQSCHADPGEACVYHVLERNCVDFVQEVYETTDLEGNVHDYFTDVEMLNWAPTEVFANKALAYGYLQSRGPDRFIDNTFRITETLERWGIAPPTKAPPPMPEQFAALPETSQEIPQPTSFQVRTSTPERPCYYTAGGTNVIDMTGVPQGALITQCKLQPYKPPFQKSELNIVAPFFESATHAAAISGVSTLAIDVAKELNVPAEYIRITERTVSILTTIYNSQSIIPTMGSEAMFQALKFYGYSDSQALIASRITSVTIRAAQNYANPLGFVISFTGELTGSAVGTTLAKGALYGTKGVIYGTTQLGRAAIAITSYVIPQPMQDTLSQGKTALFSRMAETSQHAKDLFAQTYQSTSATVASFNIKRIFGL